MSQTLKSLLAREKSVVAPGVGDALTALMVEKAGFSCVYVSGYQVSATMGYPDMGLITMTEMAHQIDKICSAVKIPVFADADTGYGNVLNVARTVKEFERVGVSAIHIEDQVFPKKCSRLAGKALVSIDEMCGTVKAAVDARKSDHFMIVGRTEAASCVGFDEAVIRANRYLEAGADAVMYQSPQSIDDLKKFRALVPGRLVVTLGSWDLDIDVKGVQELGYEVVLIPNATMRASIKAVTACLDLLKATGDINKIGMTIVPNSVRDNLLKVEEYAAREKKYLF